MVPVFQRFKKLVSRDFSEKYRCNLNPDRGASQGGEDGLIREICKRLHITNGFFVEFGAWDGVSCSNTFALAQQGWRGLYIEGAPERAAQLEENMSSYPDISTLCRFIETEGENGLEAILEESAVPKDFDLLSIDVDGIDYWLWKSIVNYQPKIVVVEYNGNFQPDECKSIPYNPRHEFDGTMFYGASAAALNKLALAKGYTLVASTPLLNLLFVRSDLAENRFRPLAVENVKTGTVHKQERRNEFVDV